MKPEDDPGWWPNDDRRYTRLDAPKGGWLRVRSALRSRASTTSFVVSV